MCALHGLTWFSSVSLSSPFSRMRKANRNNRPTWYAPQKLEVISPSHSNSYFPTKTQVSRLLAAPLYLHCTLSRLFCQRLCSLAEKFFKRGNTVSFSLHFVKSCAMLSVVQPAPRQAVPPRRFPSGVKQLLLPPIDKKRGGGWYECYMVWLDSVLYSYLRYSRVCREQKEVTAHSPK